MCVLTCVFAISSCGKNDEDENNKKKLSFDYDEEMMIEGVTSTVESMAELDDEKLKELLEDYNLADETEKMESEGVKGFMDAREESGMFIGFYLDEGKNVKYKLKEDYENDAVIVTINSKFEERDVKIIFTFNVNEAKDGFITEMKFEPKYTLGETMKDAGLNTLIGITTVVVILTFLSLIISLFKHVSKFEAFLEKRKNRKNNNAANKKDVVVEKVDEAEEYVDDLELVAVITAAVAASQGTSSDGFVVRTIKRVNRR